MPCGNGGAGVRRHVVLELRQRHVSSGTGAAACVPCARGEFANATGLVSCLLCPAGQFQNATASSTCAACPEGRSSDADGAVACQGCPPGRYQSASTLLCEPCAAGRFGNLTGETACAACEPGSYAPVDGSVACVPCPAGRFSGTSGAKVCAECPPQTFTGTDGLSACEPCADLRFANQNGSQFCGRCDPDKYLVLVDRLVGECVACPPAASCVSGQPVALAQSWVGARDARSGEFRSYQCLPGRCVSVSSDGACPSSSAAASDAAPRACCAEGRVKASSNPLCGACLPGLEELGGTCVACSSPNRARVAGFVVLGFVLLFVIQHITSGVSGAALSKVAVGFAQVFSTFFAEESANPVSSGGALLGFNLVGLSSSCVAPMSDLTRAVLPLLQVLLVTCLFAALAVLNAVWWRLRGRRARFRTSPFYRVALALALFSFVPIVRVAVGLMRCVDVEGDRLLRQFPTVSCESAGYRAWLAASLSLSVSVFACVSAFVLLHGQRRYRAYVSAGGSGSAPKLLRKQIERRFGFLFLSYRGTSAVAASWEVVVLLRGAAFVAAAALAETSETRFALMGMLSALSLAAHQYVQPFGRRQDNQLEMCSLSLLLFVSILNGPSWRAAAGAYAATALLFYGFLGASVALGAWQQWRGGRLGLAMRKAGGRLGDANRMQSSSAEPAGGQDALKGRYSWASRLHRFVCWHAQVPGGSGGGGHRTTERPAGPGAGDGVAPRGHDRPEPAAVEMSSRSDRFGTAALHSANEDRATPPPPYLTDAVAGEEESAGEACGLPDGWVAFEDDSGTPYYCCASTGESRWERPEQTS